MGRYLDMLKTLPPMGNVSVGSTKETNLTKKAPQATPLNSSNSFNSYPETLKTAATDTSEPASWQPQPGPAPKWLRQVIDYRFHGDRQWYVFLGTPGESYEQGVTDLRRQYGERLAETRQHNAPRVQP